MGRPTGARNSEYENRRSELLARLLPAIVASGGQISLHEMARATGTSIPTIKHYFGDRSQAVAEALRTVQRDAAVHIRAIADPKGQKLAASLLQLARDLAAAWIQYGVGAIFTAGLAAGLFDEQAGPGYLDGVLEPTLRALEERLTIHALRRELRISAKDVEGLRAAALAFLSPVLVALLHQHGLSGARCRPLDLDSFLAFHVAHYVKAYGKARVATRLQRGRVR